MDRVLNEVVPSVSVLWPGVPMEKPWMRLPSHILSKPALWLLLVSRCCWRVCISYVYSKFVVKETMKRQKSLQNQGLASTKAMHCILLQVELLLTFALACCCVKNLSFGA